MSPNLVLQKLTDLAKYLACDITEASGLIGSRMAPKNEQPI